MWYPEWKINQQNLICFVQVDGNYLEVPGLGVNWNLFISKAGGVFNPSAGVKAELSHGWYSYLSTAAEADTIGPVSIYVVSVPLLTITQNLEYTVQQRNVNCHPFTYTLINSVTLLPVESAKIWITTDLAGLNTIWNGFTDVFGIARDNGNYLPCLDSGVYFFFAKKAGGIANNWPDTEIVP